MPARGLIGFRTEFLTETRGTGQLHHVFEGFEPWHGDLRTRQNGSLVADREGSVTGYARAVPAGARRALRRPRRARLPGHDRRRRNARSEDLDVNPTREKHLTNHRKAYSEELVRLVPHRELSLEQALEFIREDECVEVTPGAVRLRKVELDASQRALLAKRRKLGAPV